MIHYAKGLLMYLRFFDAVHTETQSVPVLVIIEHQACIEQRTSEDVIMMHSYEAHFLSQLY